MTTPIFILGRQRSGTTWLANQLSEHPSIAAVRHEHHHGVHESAYFSHILGRYGDLETKGNFAEFAEVMSASDYLRIAGITKDFLYSLWPASYEEVFRALMDEFADTKGATYWLEKTPHHTLDVDLLAKIYNDAKFVAVTREVESVIKSALPMQAEPRLRRIVRSAVNWTYYNRVIQSFARRQPERIFLIQYTTLRENLAGTLEEICSFLEVPYDPCMLQQSYPPNTTFASSRQRRALGLTREERLLIRTLVATASLVPLSVLDWRRRRRRSRCTQSLPPWFFSVSPFYKDIESER